MQKLRAIGYTAVQLDLEHHPDLPAADIKRMVDDAGLQICMTHFGYELFLHELAAIIERQQDLGVRADGDCRHAGALSCGR